MNTGWAQTNSVETPSNEPTDTSLEELLKMKIPIVEAASKYEQKITEAPSSVTIITSDEVKMYGHRTLADILATVPGFYVNYDRNYSFLGVRGFSGNAGNDHVLVLVDGHRINSSLNDSAALGTDFILDVDLIDRVEVIRGPGSSLYGDNAFFGVINVITRRGRDTTGVGAEASFAYGSFDTYQGRATYGNRFKNGLEMLLSGTIYDSAGQDRLYFPIYDQRINPGNPTARNNGFAENADQDEFKSVFGRISYTDFNLEGGYISRGKNNPTAQFLTDFNDSRLKTTDNRGYVDLGYSHEFSGIVDVTAQIYYDRNDHEIVEPYVRQGGFLIDENQVGEWWGAEAQLTKRLWDRITLTLGGEYRDDFRQERHLSDARTGVPISNGSFQTNRQNYGVYIEGDFGVLTNLHVNAGGRYDQYGDFDPSFNPRLALIYNPIGQTVFKAIYGTAFRAPSFLELVANRNPGAPALPEPEKITTYELVYEQGIGDHLRSSVAGFYNQIDHLITFQTNAYRNIDNAEAKGVELALDAFWPNGLRGRASYSYQETKDRTTGNVLIDSPKHAAKLNVSVPLWRDKIFAGLEVQFLSKRTTTRLSAAGTPEAGGDAPDYGIVNLNLFSQNLLKGLDFSADVYNLLDRKYSDPSTPFHRQDLIEQDGRTFRVKLTYRF